MKQTSINLPKLIYRTDQPKKDGSNTFYLQLHHNGVKKLISLKVSCTPDYYDVKNNRIRKSHPHGEQYNLIIETQLSKAVNIILNARVRDEPITINNFLNLYLGKSTDSKKADFFSFVEEEIERERKKSNKADATVDKYGFQLNKLKRYKSRIEFNDITEDFLADFEVYMREKLKNKKSSSNNTLKFIRKFMNVARKKGVTKNYPFENYQIKEQKETVIKHLTIDEFNRIKAYFKDLDRQHKHFLTLRSFIFSCYTGLRYGDNKKFRLNNIIDDCVVIATEKTKTTINVPLISAAKELLDFNLAPELPNLNTPCDQTCNKALKEIAKNCGIDKKITTHYARHTFGCIALNHGIPKEIIQAVLGHSTSKQTDHYAKLNGTFVKAEMAKLDHLFTDRKGKLS